MGFGLRRPNRSPEMNPSDGIYNRAYFARENLYRSKKHPPIASEEKMEEKMEVYCGMTEEFMEEYCGMTEDKKPEGMNIKGSSSNKQEESIWKNVALPTEDEKEEYSRGMTEYCRQVEKSDRFDIEGIAIPRGSWRIVPTPGLVSYDCQAEYCRYHDRVLVKLYASVGLHRYNMLEGTNFELSALMKFNKSLNCVSSYYITLVAHDPVSRSQQTFQVEIDEHRYGSLDLVCSIARPKGVTTKEPVILPKWVDGLPEWPSGNDAFNDRKRFHVVKESELRDNYWIRLYLELVLCSYDRWISDRDLSKLKILKVVIETNEEDVESPNGRLNAKTAIVYITFKGLAKAGRVAEIGEHVERKAIVRRVIHERTGYLSLRGEFLSGEKRLSNIDMASLIDSPEWMNSFSKDLPPWMRS